jgi:DNA-binding response OmpR family regulator
MDRALNQEDGVEELARILVIEDDPEISEVLRLDLLDEGFTVNCARNGVEGLTKMREWNPDLVILDLGLPDLAGDEVARRIKVSYDTPVMVLTAADAIERKLALFGQGADDYVVKPFEAREVIARIHARLRNNGLQVIKINRLEIQPSRRRVCFSESEIRLSPKEFDLINLLASRPGRVFTRQEIEEKVWGEGLDSSSNVVDVHIANLRQKLRDAGATNYVKTVRGMGYVLRDPSETVGAE